MKKHVCKACGKKELIILDSAKNPGLVIPGVKTEKYYSTCDCCGYCGSGKNIKECQQ